MSPLLSRIPIIFTVSSNPSSSSVLCTPNPSPSRNQHAGCYLSGTFVTCSGLVAVLAIVVLSIGLTLIKDVNIALVITLMLLSGVCNTIITKYQDMQCVENCSDPDVTRRRYFEQPVIQTIQMFIGEMGCYLFVILPTLFNRDRTTPLTSTHYTVVPTNDESEIHIPAGAPIALIDEPDNSRQMLRIRMTRSKYALLALPASCDIAGTTLMNVGLLFVAASVYQMTRGALVLFVGLFSVVLLKQKITPVQWISMFLVFIGVSIVSLANIGSFVIDAKGSFLQKVFTELNKFFVTDSSSSSASVFSLQAFLGVILVLIGQFFTASQFILEECLMRKYFVEPEIAVTWEGIWGFTITLTVMIIGYLTYGRSEYGQHGYFDLGEGLHQVVFNYRIAISSLVLMISIGCLNFFGLLLTRHVSATFRSLIDTCRTLFIWIVSLTLGWETFKWLQVLGFLLLVIGTYSYHEIVTWQNIQTLLLQSRIISRIRKRFTFLSRQLSHTPSDPTSNLAVPSM